MRYPCNNALNDQDQDFIYRVWAGEVDNHLLAEEGWLLMQKHNSQDSPPTTRSLLDCLLGQSRDVQRAWRGVLFRYNFEDAAHRTKLEAKTGKCDAAGLVSIPDFFKDIYGDKKLLERVKNMSLFLHPPFDHERRQAAAYSGSALVSEGHSLVVESKNSSGSQRSDHMASGNTSKSDLSTSNPNTIFRAIGNGTVLPSAEEALLAALGRLSLAPETAAAAGRTVLRAKFEVPTRIQNPELAALDLPLLMVEYKTYNATGGHQIRFYCVAAAKFLAALGIYEFPVFGLVIEGCIGVVVCAWMKQGEDGEVSGISALQ